MESLPTKLTHAPKLSVLFLIGLLHCGLLQKLTVVKVPHAVLYAANDLPEHEALLKIAKLVAQPRYTVESGNLYATFLSSYAHAARPK